MSKNWTVIEILRRGTEYFTKKDIESPRLNIELLLSDLLNISRLELYTQFDKPLTQNEIGLINKRCIRRSKREPLQYIIGKHQFIDLYLKIDSRALIPRPETELLADIASRYVQSLQLTPMILDIGTGSGCIALHIAKNNPKAQVIGVDISQETIDLAKENAVLNNIDNVKFHRTDILVTIPKKQYDLVISNPPYIPETDYLKLKKELFFEPKIALSDGENGLKFYKRFAEIFDKIIKSNCAFLIEIGYGQEGEISNLFNKAYNLELIKDFNGIIRFIRGIKQ